MTNKKSKWILVKDEYNIGDRGTAIIFEDKKEALEHVKNQVIKDYSIKEFLKTFKLYEVVSDYEIVNAMAFIREDECQE